MVDHALQVAAVELGRRSPVRVKTTGSLHVAGIAQAGGVRSSAAADRAKRSGNTWYITASAPHAGGGVVAHQAEVVDVAGLGVRQPRRGEPPVAPSSLSIRKR